MTIRLNDEVSDAIRAAGDKPVPVIDPSSNRVYLIVDPSNPADAIEAIRRQEALSAVQQGIDSMESGNGISIDESQRRTEETLRSRSS